MSSDEGEDLLPTQQLHAKRPQDELDDEDSHHERHLLRQLEEIRDDRQKVTTAYRTAWTNFYAWEAEACNSTLASLAAPLEHSRSGRSLAELFDANDSDEDQIVDDSSLAATFTTVDFDTDGTITSSCERIIIPEVTPHPKYESCTPATKVVRVSKSESCPFVPYAGEPGFSAQDYIQTFSSTDWQHRWHDPDIIYIALEAVKLLGEMPIKSIDSWGILPTLLDNNRQIGIARKLKWHYGELWRTAALKDIDYDNLVNRLNNTEECFNLLKENEKYTLFCPRLSCIEGSCLTHLDLPIIKRKERKPHKQTGDLEQKDTCGPQCFSAILDGLNKHDMLNPVDAQLVHDLWSLFPDESPCDIAIMARLPCYQVQYQRTLKFSDHDISPKPNHNFKLPSGFKFVDDSPEVYLSAAPLSPCSHFGSCESRGCECFHNHVHCQRNCQCDLQCPLRHQGCRCLKGCRKSCKCRMASRECDPEICKSRLSGTMSMLILYRSAKRPHYCVNMQIQTEAPAAMEVKSGSYGLGTFTQEIISEYKYVGEYVAEIAFKDRQESPIIDEHRHLNYNFNLDEHQVLNAAYVGNETRYLNHQRGTRANIFAEVKRVNGDHRIGYYANANKIMEGKELYLDYGEEYWADQKANADNDEPQNERQE